MTSAFDSNEKRIVGAVVSLIGLLLVPGLSAWAASATLAGLTGAGPTSPPNFWQQVLAFVGQWQFSLQQSVIGAVQAIKANGTGHPVWTLTTLAFLYGVFHAMGPGHGKMVISSYLLAHRSRMRRGILLAVLASFIQALSAIAMVGVLAILLDMPRLETTARVRELEIVSYGLMVAVGLWMLVSALRGRHGCDHGSHHPDSLHSGGGRSAEENAREPRTSLRQLAAMVLAVGIRPCSGSIILLLFTLSQAMLAVGIAAVFIMALGTALTVSALALFTVLSRKAILGMAGATVWENRIHQGLSIAGSLAIVLFGGILLLATICQPNSL